MGAIVIDDQGCGRHFTDRDRALLRLFAAQAAVAVENAQLYTQVRQDAEQLVGSWDS